jgi:hypothetical protein
MAHILNGFGTEPKCDECKIEIRGDVWHLCTAEDIKRYGLKNVWVCLDCLLLLQLGR